MKWIFYLLLAYAAAYIWRSVIRDELRDSLW